MHKGFLLTGSNLGNRYKYLEICRTKIGALVELEKTSKIYESPSWGISDQPNFLNQVIEFKCLINPEILLNEFQKIENELGRKREFNWGSRTIDVDLLYFDDLVMNKKSLTLPHPEILNRRFTLVPLVEIAPDFIHPIIGKSNFDLLNQCKDKGQVWLYDHSIDETSASG